MPAKLLIESVPRAIRVLRRLTVAALDGSITFHQTRVLYLIKEGLGQSQIAESLQVSPAAVCKLMHQLVDKGYISMGPGKDRRERELLLTKEGTKTLNAVNRVIEKKLSKGIEHLNSQEQEDLQKGLRVMEKLMGQIKEG